MKNKIIFWIAVGCICLFKSPLYAQCVLWDTEHINALKADTGSPLYEKIIGSAYWYSGLTPATVTDKTDSFSGNKNNYESLSFYTWPDEKNPQGPWIVKTGYINPMYKDYDFERMMHMSNALRNLAIAYYMTHDQLFYDSMIKWIDTWFINPATRMLPNMDYTQVRPGEDNNRGTCWGIIEAYSLIEVFEAYRLAESVTPFKKDINKKMHLWVKEFTQWMINSENGKQQSQVQNSLSTAYDVTLFYLAAFNNNKPLMKKLHASFADMRMEAQISEDGHMPYEMDGNRVFHDHMANIQHIVDFCILQKQLGKDYYAEHQEIIDRAVGFLLPYLHDHQQFPYTQVSDWSDDISDFKIELMRLSRFNSKYSANRLNYTFDPFETDRTVTK